MTTCVVEVRRSVLKWRTAVGDDENYVCAIAL
jgi:hypothetical protein